MGGKPTCLPVNVSLETGSSWSTSIADVCSQFVNHKQRKQTAQVRGSLLKCASKQWNVKNNRFHKNFGSIFFHRVSPCAVLVEMLVAWKPLEMWGLWPTSTQERLPPPRECSSTLALPGGWAVSARNSPSHYSYVLLLGKNVLPL